jgi:hypothetical protein
MKDDYRCFTLSSPHDGWGTLASVVQTHSSYRVHNFLSGAEEVLGISVLGFAILAWSVRRAEPCLFRQKLSIYMFDAIRSLNRCMEYHNYYHQMVLASNLLGWLAYTTCSDLTQAHEHFKGSIALLNFFIEENWVPELRRISVLGPFVLDCANAWAMRHGGIPQRRTSFAQRIKYFDEFSLPDHGGAWHSSSLEAANSTLGNLLEVALSFTKKLAESESHEDLSRANVADILQYMMSELGDPDLHRTLQTLRDHFQGANTNHTIVEGQLITRIFHRLRCVLLLLAVLEAPTIDQGVTSPKARFIGTKVISICRIQTIRRGGLIEDYYLMSWHNFTHLLLGGMTLSPRDNLESMPHSNMNWLS